MRAALPAEALQRAARGGCRRHALCLTAACVDEQVCKRIFPEGCVEGENKGYSRDYEAQWPPMRGRIRVRLFDAEGKPTNPDITTRKQLFLKVAELIPRMPSRQAGYVDPHTQVRPRRRDAPFAVSLPSIVTAASCYAERRPPARDPAPQSLPMTVHALHSWRRGR
jgi:hypothetical protein